MTTVKDILDYVHTLAPEYMKMEWDNVGLLCGEADQPVKKVLIALDPAPNVVQEAVDLGVDLLLTHHPLIFDALKNVTGGSALGSDLIKLIRHRISAINAHTNLDCAPGGVNDVLAQELGLKDIQVIDPVGSDEVGQPYGLLRMGLVDNMDLQAFLALVKQALGCEGLRYCDGGKPVQRVAVGGGSCAGEMRQVAQAGCDTFVTADVKYHQFMDAKQLGINLIDAGHFHTENPICRVLAEKLQGKFPEITVIRSQNHKDCTKFF